MQQEAVSLHCIIWDPIDSVKGYIKKEWIGMFSKQESVWFFFFKCVWFPGFLKTLSKGTYKNGPWPFLTCLEFFYLFCLLITGTYRSKIVIIKYDKAVIIKYFMKRWVNITSLTFIFLTYTVCWYSGTHHYICVFPVKICFSSKGKIINLKM